MGLLADHFRGARTAFALLQAGAKNFLFGRQRHRMIATRTKASHIVVRLCA